MHIRKFIKSGMPVAMMLLLVSCNGFKTTKTQVTFSFAENVWNHFQPFISTFKITNINKTYDVSLSFSVLDNFEYDHLTLEIVLTSPDGQKNIMQKWFELRKDGKFLGETKGNIRTITHPLYTQKEFSQEGEYTLSVKCTMQYYEIFHITDVGYSVNPARKQNKDIKKIHHENII
jgi:gliding motility-associated lipoprotein GldH